MAMDKKQIYIVDDDASVCRSLKFLLLSFSFLVDSFLSAEEFFNVVPDSAPGCLIMDIHMPGMNGWEALKRISTSAVRRPVIIITGDKNDGLREKSLEIGAAGFLHKPIDDHELVSLINKVY